jgi:hypothetical protein
MMSYSITLVKLRHLFIQYFLNRKNNIMRFVGHIIQIHHPIGSGGALLLLFRSWNGFAAAASVLQLLVWFFAAVHLPDMLSVPFYWGR